MCRWLAYLGQPIFLSELLFEPENSLIDQSLHARESISTTNGDGFGIGWYAHRSEPGVFRDVLPAWNDENLQGIARQIRSGLFLAHVRASTGTSTSRSNCHPFRHGRWLFMHNGQIGGWWEVRRAIEALIAPEFYRLRTGTTDSEAMFCLTLSNGLDEDPERALARTVGQVERQMRNAGVKRPLRISLALSDSERVIALRYSSDRKSPTLYAGAGAETLGTTGLGGAGQNCLLVLSEPLDDIDGSWTRIEEASLVIADKDGIKVRPFTPEPA